MYNSLFRELLTYMMEDPRNIGLCTHLLFGAKNIERIGDHTTNIAENVHFLVRGSSIADDRPKGDQTSSTLISGTDGRRWGDLRCRAKVLIVEDEAPLAEMLRYNLEAEGFRVTHRGDRRGGARSWSQEEQPDLVVLDWMLPGVSGIELCRRLRARADRATCRSSC